ncbi:WD40-repeat-containing domain protein [Stachybotrys elegans]|uniref:WD40-repeat-containing domain protein n=1 Tax=Stachybotrys elegans TaxID=80388 RepID=A0A8K0WVR6_9HYPO|nr:WD40-repeat-containing domain protein [Stachybotrys elegans]
MATAVSFDETAFDLPRLRASFCLENDTKFIDNDDNVAEFFDVKFCPYQPLDKDPVFAAVSKKHIVLCRLIQTAGDANPCKVINVIRDDDDEASSCCCTWTKDPVTGVPYICTGGTDAKVKIYDAVTGQVVDCFTGHGGDVNDLATSPIDSSIIASASDDTSVRLWSLDPKHKAQPCLCILAGEGHSWNLLSVAFHDSGRYLLSAGHDQIINLWTIPDLPTEPVATPLQVHYPHFSTSAVHSGIVDCVSFYGDLILSRACHDNVIVLWRVEGFSSDDPPPPQSIAPTPQSVTPTNYDPGRLTRSAFVPAISPQCPSQYTRVLEFFTPNCGPQFFMRFKLHFVPDQNPVLAFCNAGGQIFFWDLKRLTTYRDVLLAHEDHDHDKSQPQRLPLWLKAGRQKGDTKARGKGSAGDRESQSSMQIDTSKGKDKDDIGSYNAETLESWASKYSMEDPHDPLRAHKTESSTANFVGRQAAWSPGGEWCVIVGSSNTALILQRWRSK